MPKLKTKSSTKGRFRLTASGKVRMQPAKKSHYLMRKSKKMKRQHRGTEIMSKADSRIVRRFMPYG